MSLNVYARAQRFLSQCSPHHRDREWYKLIEELTTGKTTAPVAEQVPTEVWEVWNRTTSTLFATENDADEYMRLFPASIGLTKGVRNLFRIQRELPHSGEGKT